MATKQHHGDTLSSAHSCWAETLRALGEVLCSVGKVRLGGELQPWVSELNTKVCGEEEKLPKSQMKLCKAVRFSFICWKYQNSVFQTSWCWAPLARHTSLALTEHELWADAYLFINIFYFMLLIVPDAGEGNDFQMRRFFLSLEHSCTWNANFNQLLDGEICNTSAISAGFPFIPVAAVGLCPLEEIWIVCKII